MNYRDYKAEQLSYIVSVAIVKENIEVARRNFEQKYNKQAPPSSTVRDWCSRFKSTLSLLPQKRIGDHSNQRLTENQKNQVISQFEQQPTISYREVAKLTGISLGSVNNILKEEKIYA